MLESTRLRQEELRLQNEINDLPEVRLADDRGNAADYEEAERRRNEGIGRLAAVRGQIIEALRAEDVAAQAAMATNADTSGWTPEMREFHQLGQRTSMEAYMEAGIALRQLTPGTPEHEYNAHVFGNTSNVGEYPVEMLLDRGEYFSLEAHQAAHVFEPDAEQRTEITGVVGSAGNLTFVDRLMQSSEGAYLRATYPVVGPGRHSYPVFTGGIGTVIARGTAETPAGALNVESADPRRIQKSYEIARADELRMPGVLAAAVPDLRMSLASGLDNVVVDDTISGLTAQDVTSGTTLAIGGLIAAMHGVVDGKGASFFREVRLLAGNTAATSQTTAFSRLGVLLSAVDLDALFEVLANVRASAHMPAASGGEDNIIAIKTGAAPPRLIVPTWRRGEFYRDTGRLQLQGTITVTGAMYADVILAANDIHTQLRVETQ